MNLVSATIFFVWMLLILAQVFIALLYRPATTGWRAAIQILSFMYVNDLAAILFFISMGFSFEQLGYVAVLLLIVTSIGAVAGYWLGKKIERTLESTEEQDERVLKKS